MPVDILSIAPPSDIFEVVPFGGSEITIYGLRVAQIARIAQRLPAFRKVYFMTKEEQEAAGLDLEFRAAAMVEAYPAIIAAGIRKDAAPDARLVEAHIERFPQEDISRVARAILRLTNGEPEPTPEEKKDDRPLPGDAGALPAIAASNASPILSPQSSS